MTAEKLIRARFFTTLRLEGPTNRATGFVVRSDTGQAHLVTARHVLDDLEELTVHFVAADHDGKPVLGRSHAATVHAIGDRTTPHPDDDVDLAVVSFDDVLDAVTAPVCLQEVPAADLASDNDLKQLDVVQEVTFNGHPGGMFDRAHLTPLVRRGLTATPPMLDFDGRPLFVVDAPVFPGSSGSPVFAGPGNVGSQLLGVLGTAKGLQARMIDPTADDDAIVLLDLGLVYKATALSDLLALAER